jgi:hypothetical protein
MDCASDSAPFPVFPILPLDNLVCLGMLFHAFDVKILHFLFAVKTDHHYYPSFVIR